MSIVKIPTLNDFWQWLMLLAYRRYMANHRGTGTKATGVPGNRDPDNPCTAYAPRKRKPGDWRDCDTDGHYLCVECVHRKEEPKP